MKSWPIWPSKVDPKWPPKVTSGVPRTDPPDHPNWPSGPPQLTLRTTPKWPSGPSRLTLQTTLGCQKNPDNCTFQRVHWEGWSGGVVREGRVPWDDPKVTPDDPGLTLRTTPKWPSRPSRMTPGLTSQTTRIPLECPLFPDNFRSGGVRWEGWYGPRGPKNGYRVKKW